PAGPPPRMITSYTFANGPPPPTRNAEVGTRNCPKVLRVPRSDFRVHSNIASGFSSICLSVLRNAAPVAPSITRWSQLMVIRIPDHRRDEAVLHRHRHPNMHLVPGADVILLEPGVAGRMLGERVRGRLDDDVVERDLAPPLIAELLVEGFARLARPLHVYFGGEEEMGNGPERRGQPLRDGLTDLGQRHVVVRGSGPLGKRDTGNRKRCPSR